MEFTSASMPSILPSPSSDSLDTPASTVLSIHQLIRLYCRERLIVHPLEWTDGHLELLQSTFERPCRTPVLVCPDALAENLEGKSGAGLVKRLGENYGGREALLRSILFFNESPFFWHT